MNFFAVGFLMIVLVQIALASITVTIGNGVRISAQGTQTRYKDPYKCYWDCDLVGCQLSRFDDECAYDCEKVCRSRYDYVGRSDNGAIAAAAAAAEAASNNNIPTDNELKPKSSAPDAKLPIENLVDPIGKFRKNRVYLNILKHHTL